MVLLRIVAGVLCLQMGKDDKFFSGHFEDTKEATGCTHGLEA